MDCRSLCCIFKVLELIWNLNSVYILETIISKESWMCPVGPEQRSTYHTPFSLSMAGEDGLFRDHQASQQFVTSHFQVSLIMTRHQLEMLDDYSMPILFFNPCIDLLPSLTSFFLSLLTVAFSTVCGREFQTWITCCGKRPSLWAVCSAWSVSVCVPSFQSAK